MKWPAFGYVRARDLNDALARWSEGGDDARLLAGGQTLLAALAFRLSEPSILIDVTGVRELQGVTEAGGVLRIGALTTHAQLGEHALVRALAPLLTEAVPLIAHAAIRNRGTIGGSLAYADPAAELPACMVALDATIVAISAKGERRIPAEDFFTGLLTTALGEHELIAAVEIPKSAATRRASIQELARRSGDYAMAGLAATFDEVDGVLQNSRLVFFGVGEGPVRARIAEAALNGRPLGASAAEAQAALSADLDPPADMHGSSAFKLQLCRTLLTRMLARFAPSAKAAA